jgi:hypothetical protein
MLGSGRGVSTFKRNCATLMLSMQPAFRARQIAYTISFLKMSNLRLFEYTFLLES